MKKYKVFLSVVLAFIMAFSCISFGFAESESRSALIKAKPVSVGFNTLVNEFAVVKSSSGMKYAYYDPVIDSDDNTKYPVVIYIHGLGHAWTDTTFRQSGLTYWASREMQNLFDDGGAHLIMPKIPELSITATQTSKIYSVITEYVNKNINNIDTDQIYVMGGSAGGGSAWRLLITHPGYFAAGVVLCSTKTISASDAKTVANIPIWEISANTDPLVNISGQSSTWNNIKKYSNVKENCRWTRFANHVTLPDGSRPGLSHLLAKTIGYNLCLISNGNALPGMDIKDGNGNSVSVSFNNGIVQWMQNSNKKYQERKAIEAAEAETLKLAVAQKTEEPDIVVTVPEVIEPVTEFEVPVEVTEPELVTAVTEPETTEEVTEQTDVVISKPAEETVTETDVIT